MHFAAIALIPVPDTATAQRLHGLDDLDPTSIAKLLHHREKQATGRDDLPLLQQQVAAASYVGLERDGVAIWTRSALEHPEARVLEKLFAATKGLERIVTWDGTRRTLPLLKLRALRHDLRAAAFWRLTAAEGPAHLDLNRAFGTDLGGAASLLSTLAAIAGLPMPPDEGTDPWDAWSAGDVQALRARGETEAVMLYLLALRCWRVSGILRRSQAGRAEAALREALKRQRAPHLHRLLDGWPAA